MWKLAGRLLRNRVKHGDRGSLPRYVDFEIRGNSWGEAIWSILHGFPIRTNIIPERTRRVLNLWGPAGWLKNSRFNRSR